MKSYSPSTDNPATRAAAKKRRLADIARDHGAAGRVRRWCTSPVPMRGASICIAPPLEDGNAQDDD